MAEIKAFQALRFTKKAGELAELVCPPYDIISEQERQAFLGRNPHNIIRLELPRDGEDPYLTAGETMREWLADGILARDEAPGLYLYEEEFTAYGKRRRVKGLVCRVRLEPFERGIVLPHEETLSKAKADRLNLMQATGANFSSIYSLYFDESREIAERLERLSAGAPDTVFETPDGIVHRLWRVADEPETRALEKAFADKKLYIADGHHRYETALNYRNGLTGEHPGADYIMMTLVAMEHEGLVVFPTHRVVRELPGFDPNALLEGCRRYFEVSRADAAEEELARLAAQDEKAFALYEGGRTHLLILKDRQIMSELLPDASPSYRQLDVSILHTLVLERLLGIDKENMANQKNLIYTRDAAEARGAVDGGQANCAFLINATRVEEIASVAGAGEKMPQKSTYFYPKLITGHLMNQLL